MRHTRFAGWPENGGGRREKTWHTRFAGWPENGGGRREKTWRFLASERWRSIR